MQIGFLHKCCLNSYGNSVHANERKKERNVKTRNIMQIGVKELAIYSLVPHN